MECKILVYLKFNVYVSSLFLSTSFWPLIYAGALLIVDLAEIVKWDSNLFLAKFVYLHFLISSFILLSKPLLFGRIFSDRRSHGSRKEKVLIFYEQTPMFLPFLSLLYAPLRVIDIRQNISISSIL